MFKTQLNNNPVYHSPECDVMKVGVDVVLCTSPFGELGKAGAPGMKYDNSEEEDY